MLLSSGGSRANTFFQRIVLFFYPTALGFQEFLV